MTPESWSGPECLQCSEFCMMLFLGVSLLTETCSGHTKENRQEGLAIPSRPAADSTHNLRSSLVRVGPVFSGHYKL